MNILYCKGENVGCGMMGDALPLDFIARRVLRKPLPKFVSNCGFFRLRPVFLFWFGNPICRMLSVFVTKQFFYFFERFCIAYIEQLTYDVLSTAIFRCIHEYKLLNLY